MLGFAKPVSRQEVEKNVDFGSSEHIPEEDVRFYRSVWHGKDVYFFNNGSTEVVFIKDDSQVL